MPERPIEPPSDCVQALADQLPGHSQDEAYADAERIVAALAAQGIRLVHDDGIEPPFISADGHPLDADGFKLCHCGQRASVVHVGRGVATPLCPEHARVTIVVEHARLVVGAAFAEVVTGDPRPRVDAVEALRLALRALDSGDD